MKARDVSAATAGRTGTRRNMILIGGLAAFLVAAFAVLLGTGAPSAGADAACPNEAIRAAQRSTHTADCRAWERVSPADKGGGEVYAGDISIMAEEEGNGATFDSLFGFGDTVGSGVAGRTTYLARRGPAGWAIHSITPTSAPETNQVLYAKNEVEVFSEDLDTALLWAYDLPGVTGDSPQRMNLYLEDTATGALRPVSVSQAERLNFFDFIDSIAAPILGASDDLEHLAFGTTTQLLPEAEPFTQNIYKWDDGGLSVVRLPDGKVPSAGANVEVALQGTRSTMSEDGTRLAFTSTGDGSDPAAQLYLQIDGQGTVWVSEPERASWKDGTDKSLPANVGFEGMTPDGQNVFFVSESPLLDADTAPGPDLYRYTVGPDPEDESNLTLITNTGGSVHDFATFGGPLVGMSDDGRIVYVHDIGSPLTVWEDAATRTIDTVGRSTEARHWLTLAASEPGNGRVSPDGDWLAYLGSQMFLYDREHDRVICASCPGDASLRPKLASGSDHDHATFRPRFLSNDGRVFFTSTAALVSEDVNTVADVYEFDGPTEKLSLVSSGTGNQPSEFADASASGDDVFFVTRAQLVPSDHDEYVDLYDARVGGGFDEAQPPSSPCLGEACRAGASGAADGPPIASVGATRGNVKPRRSRCGKHRKLVKRHGKARCVKPKRHGHRRGSK